MKYVSIDLETTGLDPEVHQIIEVAAVVDDLSDLKPLDELPKISIFVRHDVYHSASIATHMNARIFKILADYEKKLPIEKSYTVLSQILMLETLEDFLKIHFNNGQEMFKDSKKMTVAGKNFSGFDRPFLKHAGFNINWFHHRVLDPGPMYVDMSDNEIPNTDTCLKRAGLVGTTTHEALQDALDVIKLIRMKLVGKV